MALRLHYCDHHEIPLPEGHKFPMAKYRLLREALAGDPRLELTAARLAEQAEIETVHDAGYVRDFLKGMLEPAVMRRIGFPWSQGLVRRTLASVGGTIDAAFDALESGCGGNLAGGTHHAFRDSGAGFCVFNDIAVAIQVLRQRGAVGRAAVVDLDVHQGDGTAVIFREDPDVLTVSIHGANNFPFRKQTSKVDLPLPDGAGDAEFLEAVSGALQMVFEFPPDIVLFQSGVDGLASDGLGRLKLTRGGLQVRDRLVTDACRAHETPLVITLGGGYAEPIEDSVAAHASTFRTAAESFAT